MVLATKVLNKKKTRCWQRYRRAYSCSTWSVIGKEISHKGRPAIALKVFIQTTVSVSINVILRAVHPISLLNLLILYSFSSSTGYNVIEKLQIKPMLIVYSKFYQNYKCCLNCIQVCRALLKDWIVLSQEEQNLARMDQLKNKCRLPEVQLTTEFIHYESSIT